LFCFNTLQYPSNFPKFLSGVPDQSSWRTIRRYFSGPCLSQQAHEGFISQVISGPSPFVPNPDQRVFIGPIGIRNTSLPHRAQNSNILGSIFLLIACLPESLLGLEKPAECLPFYLPAFLALVPFLAETVFCLLIPIPVQRLETPFLFEIVHTPVDRFVAFVRSTFF